MTVKLRTVLSVKQLVFILITSVICITICSQTSPIYSFNNNLDVNCFFTVGKALTNKVIVYKDLFEQKGPLLYFMFSLAYLIHNTTFFGVYVLETIAFFSFLVIAYKTLCLFNEQCIIYTIPIIATIMCSSHAFAYGGSAEEFCLPFVALCNYFGLKALLLNRGKISMGEWLIVGMTASAVLWIKFSLLGFYIGFGLVFVVLYLKERCFVALFQAISALCIGIFIVSIPILLYFVFNDAITDLFEVYFYDNLFCYSVINSGNKSISLIGNLLHGCSSFIKCYTLGFLMTLAGLVYLIHKKNRLLLIYFLCTFFFSFFLVFIGGRHYQYYSFILSLFVPCGLLIFMPLLDSFCQRMQSFDGQLKTTKRIYCLLIAVIYSLCVLFMLLICPTTHMLKYRKEDFPQYKFEQYISQTDNPTLLNYGVLDCGFYMVSDIIPNCKYFCQLNVLPEEIKKAQDDYIKNGLIDYVVAVAPLNSSQLRQYKCISTTVFENTTYYLYQKR